MYHIKINACEKNFSSKKKLLQKQNVYILKKMIGGGGEMEL